MRVMTGGVGALDVGKGKTQERDVGTDNGSRLWEHCSVDIDVCVHLG